MSSPMLSEAELEGSGQSSVVLAIGALEHVDVVAAHGHGPPLCGIEILYEESRGAPPLSSSLVPSPPAPQGRCAERSEA